MLIEGTGVALAIGAYSVSKRSSNCGHQTRCR